MHQSLLLEQILKRMPRVAGAHAAQAGGSGGLLLTRNADLKECAIVAHIFFFDALRNRLHALEAAAGIEIIALLAGVQLESALRTNPRRRHPLQHRATLRAARHRMRSRQVHRTRAERIIPFCRRRRRRRPVARIFLAPQLFVIITIAILIPVLTIFGQSPSTRWRIVAPRTPNRK